MKKIFILLCILIVTNSQAQTGEKNFIDQNYIEVSGKAEMEIIPDLIYIKVVLSEKDIKNRMTMPEMEQKIMQNLKDIGIDVNKDVTIKDFSGALYAKLFSKEVMLNKEYNILVHNGKTAAKVFTELDKLSISNISIAKLDNSKMDEYRREVKIRAIKVAKDKAVALADAIGQKAGRAIYIAEQQTNFYPAQANITNVAYNAKGAVEFDDLNFEDLKIDATIICRFELK